MYYLLSPSVGTSASLFPSVCNFTDFSPLSCFPFSLISLYPWTSHPDTVTCSPPISKSLSECFLCLQQCKANQICILEPSVPDWGAKHEAGRISFPLPPGGPSWHACSLCATLRVALPHGILLFYIPASAETSQHREGPKFPGPLLTETWLNTNKIAQCQSSPLDFPNSLQLLFMQKLTKLCLSCRHSD